MGIRTLFSQKYLDPELGPVNLRVLSTATRYTARWKPDHILVTIPAGVSLAEYNRMMEKWKPELLKKKPRPKADKYHHGLHFATDDWEFTVVANPNVNPLSVHANFAGSEPRLRFEVITHPDYDFSSASGQKAVSTVLCRIAAKVAETHLLRQATEVAAELGLSGRVRSFSVGRGSRRLGCCDSKGNISLSRVLMFLPRELRRSTITHELAHLDHMDHSPAIYALWDRYLGHSHLLDIKREKEFEWPIVR